MIEDKLAKLTRLASQLLDSEIDISDFEKGVVNSKYAILANLSPDSAIGKFLVGGISPVLFERNVSESDSNKLKPWYYKNEPKALAKVQFYCKKNRVYDDKKVKEALDEAIVATQKIEEQHLALAYIHEATIAVATIMYKGQEPVVLLERLYSALNRVSLVAEDFIANSSIVSKAGMPDKDIVVEGLLGDVSLESIEMPKICREILKEGIEQREIVLSYSKSFESNTPENEEDIFGEIHDFVAAKLTPDDMRGIYEEAYDELVYQTEQLHENLPELIVLQRATESLKGNVGKALTELGRPPEKIRE